MKWPILFLLLFSLPTGAAIVSDVGPTSLHNPLREKLLREYKSKQEWTNLRNEILAHAGKSVPILIEAMKSEKYPERNRWLATLLIGQIMGKKSIPYMVKFLKHPHWILRLASLKTLLALNAKEFGKDYAQLLKDESLLVRMQALENIRSLNLSDYSANVWAMLYDARNYQQVKKVNKRGHIVKYIIRTVGDLKFSKAEQSMLTMVRAKKYEDIFSDLDYALTKLTGKNSPSGDFVVKRNFWNRHLLKESVI